MFSGIQIHPLEIVPCLWNGLFERFYTANFSFLFWWTIFINFIYSSILLCINYFWYVHCLCTAQNILSFINRCWKTEHLYRFSLHFIDWLTTHYRVFVNCRFSIKWWNKGCSKLLNYNLGREVNCWERPYFLKYSISNKAVFFLVLSDLQKEGSN